MKSSFFGNLTLAGALIVVAACSGCDSDNGDSPAPAAAGGKISGRVTDAASGNGVASVLVATGSAMTTTDSTGAYALTGVSPAPSVLLTFVKTGFVSQSRSTAAYTASDSEVTVNVPMLAVALTETFDSSAARTISVPSSTAQVQVPANALRTASGGMPSGMVTALVTPIAPASNIGIMPGNYLSDQGANAPAPIESFGALDVRFNDAAGNPLNLVSGQSSTLRIPLSTRSGTPPTTVPLFFFDTSTGLWKEEGTATLQGTAPDQYYEGTVIHFTTWNADQVENTVTVSGCVQDVAGARVAGATVSSEGTNYTGNASDLTDANGNFTVPMKSGATSFIQAVKDTRVSSAREVQTQTSNITQTECLVLIQGAVTIRLIWGEAPADLDSHTLGPNSTDHVYYDSQGSLSLTPFLALDVDDTDSFGPEVTTFTRVARSRQYRFYVHNFSQTFAPGQTGSPAKVELTVAGALTIFTPPAGENQNIYWDVFTLTTDANCQVTVTPVQTFTPAEPTNPNTGTDAQFCS